MPLYTFRCENGHDSDFFAKAEDWNDRHCLTCWKRSVRQSVYGFSSPKKYGSDFHWTSELRAAHDEAMGYKAEAKQIMDDAVQNGWRKNV